MALDLIEDEMVFPHWVTTEELIMFYTIAIVLAVLWAVGLISSYTMGGYIHILVVAAVVIVLVRLIQDRRHLHA
jgi:hypothetical protein